MKDSLLDLMRTAWKKVSYFMTDKCEPQTQNVQEVWWHSYGCQAKFYPYLPDLEEARDWLDKLYYKSSTKSNFAK